MHRFSLAFCVALSLPVAAAACGGGSSGPQVSGTAVVVAGDFDSTGVLSTIDGTALTVDVGAVDGVAGADPVVRRLGDELFVVNRFGGDNVTVLDAATLALVDQYATGAGSNPQDVAVVGDKMYVVGLGLGSILVFDRTTPAAAPAQIDISALDDDGMPDCVSIHAAGDQVFAACELLDNFNPVEPGVAVVIDSATDAFTTLALPAMNPVGWLEQPGGVFGTDLVVPTIPSYTDYTTGCLVRISTGATPAATCGPTNEELGGFVNRIGGEADRLWALIGTYDQAFNPTGTLVELEGAAAGPALSPPAQVLTDLTICDGHLFVADKATGAEGLRVYRADGGEDTSAALDVGLPPAFGDAIACMSM